ncbi:hypothetical protein [Sulfobacillus thermosulfidooxidans]|uniref:hypothetical protein n=1 Tax=Sulfobacillus thermosulfidooxidans TaxID=28034 RepID=UPI0006B47A21|nr:hypothetical protein [Sulfobacillus thermosulfidooxidans]
MWGSRPKTAPPKGAKKIATTKAQAKPPKVSRHFRRLVNVHHVEDGLVTRMDNTVVGIVEAHGFAFDMLQEQEQDYIYGQFRSLLHMLTFPIAIHILNERLDLSQEIGRYQERADPAIYQAVDAAHASMWAQINQAYANLLQNYTGYLDQVVYWIAIPASLPSQARERQQTVINAVAQIHTDMKPFIPSRSRILSVLANSYGHPLPGDPIQYFDAFHAALTPEPST